MAETVTVVTPVIDMLVNLLVKRSNLFRNLHREVKSLKDELESIQCFLKDAEERLEKGDVNDGVKIWVKQVREEAYHIEDVMDEYLLHVAERSHRHGFVGLLRKTGHFVMSLKPRNDIAYAIKSIKESLREIKDRGERYGFNSLEQGSSRSRVVRVERFDPRLGSAFVEEDEFIDAYSLRDELVTRSVNGELTRTVISLVGEGGVGKSTLAKQVYDSEVVKGHFDCRAWITVSQAYDPETLLMTMKQYFCPNLVCNAGEIDMMKEVISQLRQCLRTKRAYHGEILLFKEGGFQRLKLLEVSGSYRLNMVRIQTRTLPLLEELRIGLNPKLKEVPSGMQNLKSLKLIEVSEMPSEFVVGLQREGREAAWKVKHVPSVHSWYKGDGDVYDVFHGR